MGIIEKIHCKRLLKKFNDKVSYYFCKDRCTIFKKYDYDDDERVYFFTSYSELHYILRVYLNLL